MTSSTGSEANASETWRGRNFRVDNIALILTVAGGIAAGIWQGGRIQQTLQDSVTAEAMMRQAQYQELGGQIAQVSTTINEVRQDVRELRSYLMAEHTYPTPDRAARK